MLAAGDFQTAIIGFGKTYITFVANDSSLRIFGCDRFTGSVYRGIVDDDYLKFAGGRVCVDRGKTLANQRSGICGDYNDR